MSDIPSPPASRVRRPRWHDARLVVGLVLVLGSIVAGAGVVGAADRSVQVWSLRRALPAGTTLAVDDLLARPVRLYGADARLYLDAAVPLPPGAVLARDVGAGELLPAAAVLTTGSRPARRVVSIPVDRAHALGGDLVRGMKVDVLATFAEPGGRATTVVVLRAVTVVGLTRPASGFAAGKTDLGVLVEVAPADAVALTAAIEAGRIDLLRVVPGADGDGDLGPGRVTSGPGGPDAGGAGRAGAPGR